MIVQMELMKLDVIIKDDLENFEEFVRTDKEGHFFIHLQYEPYIFCLFWLYAQRVTIFL